MLASMADRVLFSIVGMLTGLTVPFSWLLWRAYAARRLWWQVWLETELKHHYDVYICTGMVSVAVFFVLGYLFGRRNDERREVSRTVEDTNLQLNVLANTDGLTGLFNSRYIHDRLDVEMETAFRSPLTCLLIDIDHFKRINDKYGHPFGDDVLTQVAKILKRVVRPSDAVGRIGGEEFIVVLPHTAQERSMKVAERIRNEVMEQEFSYEGNPVHVTISVGLVSVPAPGLRYRHALLKAVDEALYAAKRTGRNRVVVWQPPSEGKAAA